MLAGVRAAACCCGPKQREVFRRALVSLGGELVDVRPAFPLFGSASSGNDSLLRGLSHILVEDREASLSALLRELGGSSTHSALLVHSSWLSDCLRLGSRLDEGPYLLDPSPDGKRKFEATTDGHEHLGVTGKESSKKPKRGQWESLGATCLYRLHDDGEAPLDQPVRLLCLDLDGTVVRTRSGRVFPRDEFDWVLRHHSVLCSPSPA